MTDKSVLVWVHEVLGVGTLTDKPRKGKRVDGTPYLKQYRWRCTFRDAYYVCCLIWPWAHTKLPKINQVVEHYSGQIMNGKIVDINEYKKSYEFRIMFDKYIYNFLMWVNHYSTKLTSWSWCMLYSDRNKGYGNRRRQKNSEDLKKGE